MNGKTKIIATIGPVTSSEKKINALIQSGVSSFRFNKKHNTSAWHAKHIALAKKISKDLEINTSTIIDIQGASLRIGTIRGTGTLHLKRNQVVALSERNVKDILTIPFNRIKSIKSIKANQVIYLKSGLIKLKVDKVTNSSFLCKVIRGGQIESNQAINIPRADVISKVLDRKAKEDIGFAVENKVDYIALSFTRSAVDVNSVKQLIETLGGTTKVIAKIENHSGVDNFNHILNKCDAVMIARGDLGIELSLEKIPKIQKNMIDNCILKSKPVIVATQIISSMIHKPIPTRAEVTDIANIILSQADALMLSEETAIGEYPIETINTVTKIAKYNEIYKNEKTGSLNHNGSFEELVIAASIRFSTKHSKTMKLAGYLVFTESGYSARLLSSYRTKLPIFAFTQKKDTYKALSLSWGINSYKMKLSNNPKDNIQDALKILKNTDEIRINEYMIVIFGNNIGEPGGNNSISVVKA